MLSNTSIGALLAVVIVVILVIIVVSRATGGGSGGGGSGGSGSGGIPSGGCTSASDCPSGYACQGGQCVLPSGSCSTNLDCTGGAVCRNGECTAVAGCKNPGPSYYSKGSFAVGGSGGGVCTPNTPPCSTGCCNAGTGSCCSVGGNSVMCPGTGCCDQAQAGDSPCNLCANVTCPSGQMCDLSTGGCIPSVPVDLTVNNYCPGDMVVRYVSTDPGLPGLTKLASGGQITAKIPTPSQNGRVYFYPDNSQIDTGDNGETAYSWWEYNNSSDGTLGSNITYVDHIAVPYSYRMTGGNCTSEDQAVCATPLATLDLANNCPPGLLRTSPSGVQMCMAPRTYCDGLPNKGVGTGDPRCDPAVPGVAQDLMAQLKACCNAGKCTGAQCVSPGAKMVVGGSVGGSGSGPIPVQPHDIWACEDSFALDSPRCAMFQRGLFAPGSGKTFGDADDAYLADGCTTGNAGLYECQDSSYYGCAPYNDYCTWIHSPTGCPGNYCQPYDDQGGLGGYQVCNPTAVTIDLCEGDK